MSALASWQSQLSQTIVDFPLWGRLRPISSRGHAITALAFQRWSKGGLGMVMFESETKSFGSLLYACTPTNDHRFSGIDWRDGWCESMDATCARFQEDVARGKTVYSYWVRRLTPERGEDVHNALSTADQLLVRALAFHLEYGLGPFDWARWEDAFDSSSMGTQRHTGRKIELVKPVELVSGHRLVAMGDPFAKDHAWPVGLSADELCRYLGSMTRPRASRVLDFFSFQERLETYQEDNPACVWTAKQSHDLLIHLSGRKTHADLDASVFGIEFLERTSSTAATRVVAPCFSAYTASLMESFRHGHMQTLDAAWFAASHLEPVLRQSKYGDTFDFGMFSTTFQGKDRLEGCEVLEMGNFVVRARGVRGERGVLLALDGESLVHFSTTDALRQLRAYFGGILAVSEQVVRENPVFWQDRFNNREVAALLSQDGIPAHAHRHFFYEKKPVTATVTTRLESEAQAEYSLYQSEPWKWRALHGATLHGPWGWKVCLDSLVTNNALSFPSSDSGGYQDIQFWHEMLEEWLDTMGPLEAAQVFNVLRSCESWPLGRNDYKKLALHYLSGDAPLLALCEMMEFDPDGVMQALQRCEAGYRTVADCEIPADAMLGILDDTRNTP